MPDATEKFIHDILRMNPNLEVINIGPVTFKKFNIIEGMKGSEVVLVTLSDGRAYAINFTAEAFLALQEKPLQIQMSEIKMLINESKHEEAKKRLEPLLEMMDSSEKVDVLLARGLIGRMTGDYTTALIYFREAWGVAEKLGSAGQQLLTLQSLMDLFRTSNRDKSENPALGPEKIQFNLNKATVYSETARLLMEKLQTNEFVMERIKVLMEQGLLVRTIADSVGQKEEGARNALRQYDQATVLISQLEAQHHPDLASTQARLVSIKGASVFDLSEPEFLKQKDVSIIELKDAHHKLGELKHQRGYSDSAYLLGKFYERLNDTEHAAAWYDTALRVAQDINTFGQVDTIIEGHAKDGLDRLKKTKKQ